MIQKIPAQEDRFIWGHNGTEPDYVLGHFDSDGTYYFKDKEGTLIGFGPGSLMDLQWDGLKGRDNNSFYPRDWAYTPAYFRWLTGNR